MVETAEEGDRASLVRRALDVVHVDTARLQYELAIELIRARAERFRITALVVCIVAMILAAVSVSAILRMDSPAVQFSWAPLHPPPSLVERAMEYLTLLSINGL